ncbi:MAG: hypothetical protein ACRDMZ_02240, partial [Solirubrobacteraceae bacterium]
ADAELVVIADNAGALQGWPLILPPDGPVEVCATNATAASLDGLRGLRVTLEPDGTRGYADLRRDSDRLEVGGGRVRVASALDLLRIERARGNPVQAGALAALLEYRRRWPDGPPPRRDYSTAQARARIEEWSTRA